MKHGTEQRNKSLVLMYYNQAVPHHVHSMCHAKTILVRMPEVQRDVQLNAVIMAENVSHDDRPDALFIVL